MGSDPQGLTPTPVGHLRENLAAAALDLPDDAVEELETVASV
jgi:hypothetical protein